MKWQAGVVATGHQLIANGFDIFLNFRILVDGDLGVQAPEKRFAQFFFFRRRYDVPDESPMSGNSIFVFSLVLKSA